MTKTFSRIPANVPVMLDANIVIYALFPQVSQHESCKKLLDRGHLPDKTVVSKVVSSTKVLVFLARR